MDINSAILIIYNYYYNYNIYSTATTFCHGYMSKAKCSTTKLFRTSPPHLLRWLECRTPTGRPNCHSLLNTDYKKECPTPKANNTCL